MKLDELLRSATQPQHERLHQVVDLKQMTQSPELYAAALEAYWNAVAPLEAALNEKLALCREDLLSDFPARLQKHTWLLADLAYLGRSADLSVPSGGPLLTSLQHTADPLAWLAGCGYVMEGMTLGAVRIAKLVEQALGFQQETGARFFTGYGAETGPRWQAYRQWLRETEMDAATVVEAAQQAFAHFEQRLADWPLSRKGPSLYA